MLGSRGGVGQLAEFIELVALSETKIKENEENLKEAVKNAAVTLKRECEPEVQDEIAAHLLQENDQNDQTIRMAMAIIVNALVFHITIAKIEPGKVSNIAKLRRANGSIKDNISEEWRKISQEINYRPIYDLAADVLEPIGDAEAKAILNSLIKVATDIATMGVTSQHDFGGQLFQKLINDRKFLASFYTLPSSAAFIAELAVSRMNAEWTDRGAVTGLRIGDFACGTGALLSASYNAVRTRHRSEGADDSKIHKDMMEKVLVGFDIMPAATHLTASVLSGAHPEIIFNKADIATMLYGDHTGLGRGGDHEESGEEKPETFIGSLELLTPDETDDLPLIPVGHMHHSGTEGKVQAKVQADHESFDLVIMNPPFTRTTAHDAANKGVPNPAFAGFGTTKEEQDKMADRCKEIYRNRSRKKGKNAPPAKWHRDKNDSAGEGRASLATWFIDLADVKVKPGGVVAFILPLTFTSGERWEKARALLMRRYHDILVVDIASTKKNGTAFSDDTSMGECIVVATRNLGSEINSEERPFSAVAIERRPESILEAIHFAKTINAKMENESGRLCIGTQKFGRIVRHDSGFVEGTFGGIIDETVESAALALKKGSLHLPRLRDSISLPIVPLKELGVRSKDSKFVSDGKLGHFDKYSISRKESVEGHFEFPLLWAHENAREKKKTAPEWEGWEKQMLLGPDHEGKPRKGHEAKALELWSNHASRLCLNRDFRFTSQSLAACMTREKVIGGRGWPSFKCHDENWNEPVVLWMNTTLGLINFWFKGTRQQLGRSMVHPGPSEKLPVYDVRTLDDRQIGLAKEMFAEFSEQKMLIANRSKDDPVRKALDRAVLIDLLGLPEAIMEPLGILRGKWCAEPSLHKEKA